MTAFAERVPVSDLRDWRSAERSSSFSFAGLTDDGTMPVSTTRVYEDPGPEDGTRVLVDRLWPRGVSKAEAHLDEG